MKFRYIQKMHRALAANCPDGYSVTTRREGRALFTVIGCMDRDYCAPWLIAEVVEPFGFSTVYA